MMAVLRDGVAVGRWTCDLQVTGSIPAGPLLRNIGQLSMVSLRGRYSLNRVPVSAADKSGIITTAGWQVILCDPIWHARFP